MAHSHLFRLLEKKILEQTEMLTKSLAEGHANDYPRYREIVGQVRGLSDAIALCSEIEQEKNE